MEYVFSILAGLLIMLAALSGKLLTWGFLGRFVAPRLRYFVALAAGVFVVIIYGLVEEILHEGIDPLVIAGFILGAVFLEALSRIFPAHHHHGLHPEHTHSKLDARRMMLGDAVHNMHDGIALVPAFLVSPIVGLGTAIGIFLHEVVQESAEFFVLREAGYSAKRALFLNFAVSATLLIGILIATLVARAEEFTRPLVAFAAGGFAYVVLRDFIPSIVRSARQTQTYLPYVLLFACGVALMTVVTFAFPHEVHHEEEEIPLPDGFGLV